MTAVLSEDDRGKKNVCIYISVICVHTTQHVRYIVKYFSLNFFMLITTKREVLFFPHARAPPRPERLKCNELVFIKIKNIIGGRASAYVSATVGTEWEISEFFHGGTYSKNKEKNNMQSSGREGSSFNLV